jgi:hypothetical protein
MPSLVADGRQDLSSSRAGPVSSADLADKELACGIQSQVTGIGGREGGRIDRWHTIFFTFNNTIWQRNRLRRG